jgi:hypothetical protein
MKIFLSDIYKKVKTQKVTQKGEEYIVIRHMDIVTTLIFRFVDLLKYNKEYLNADENNMFDLVGFINKYIKFTDLLLTQKEAEHYNELCLNNYRDIHIDSTDNAGMEDKYCKIYKKDDIEVLSYYNVENNKHIYSLNMFNFVKILLFRSQTKAVIQTIVNTLGLDKEQLRKDYLKYKINNKKNNLLEILKRVDNLTDNSFINYQLHKDNSIKVLKIIIEIAIEQLDNVIKNNLNNALEVNGYHIISQNLIEQKWIENGGATTNIRRRLDTLMAFNFIEIKDIDKENNDYLTQKVKDVKTAKLQKYSTVISFNYINYILWDIVKSEYQDNKKLIKANRILWNEYIFNKRREKHEEIEEYKRNREEQLRATEESYNVFEDFLSVVYRMDYSILYFYI